MKAGKKPMSQKPASRPIAASDVFGNTLSLPHNVAIDLEERGLEARWVNAKILSENQGYHPKGWEVYKQPANAAATVTMFGGNNPDGIIRRGDCVLATKSKEAADKHRAYLRQQAERMTGSQAQAAKEMRELTKSNGLKSVIIEGDDDEDET